MKVLYLGSYADYQTIEDTNKVSANEAQVSIP